MFILQVTTESDSLPSTSVGRGRGRGQGRGRGTRRGRRVFHARQLEEREEENLQQLHLGCSQKANVSKFTCNKICFSLLSFLNSFIFVLILNLSVIIISLWQELIDQLSEEEAKELLNEISSITPSVVLEVSDILTRRRNQEMGPPP